MSLPSQGGIGFGGATRGRRRRGKGGPRKLLAGVVVLAIAGGLAWAFMPGGQPESPDAEPTGGTQLARAEGQGQPAADATPAALQGDRPRGTGSRLVSTPVQSPPEQEATRAQPEAQSRTVATGAPEGTSGAGDPATPSQTESRRTRPPMVLATPSQDEEPLTVVRPSAAVATLIQQAEAAIKANNPVQAREHYNSALLSERASASDRAHVREQMAALNADLIFSPRVYPNDPFATTYEVQSGDSLSRIAQREGVATEWLLIQRVNRLSNPSSIYQGQKLKLVRGPFHAVVSKSAFRMDVYIGPPGEIDQWMYVRSFPVGLGEQDGTPLGAFTVRRHSKLIDPFWRNPRTGEEFAASDPKNPIGDHWIGLRGLGQAETFSGYGIHGTIDPGSIGQEMSMGCVRMLPEDVALVYELLTEDISQVHIVE